MKRRWILIGEDDVNDVTLTSNALAGFAHDIVVALDGVEVLEHLRGQERFADFGHSYPAVLLLDLKMPRVDGIEVLREIKSDSAMKVIPVVMLTSSRHEPDIRHCYQLGANGYIVKPMDFFRYKEILQNFARFWLEVNEALPERIEGYDPAQVA